MKPVGSFYTALLGATAAALLWNLWRQGGGR